MPIDRRRRRLPALSARPGDTLFHLANKSLSLSLASARIPAASGDHSDVLPCPAATMLSRYAFNSWPNRATWLIARWLSSSKYGYMATVAEHEWLKYRGVSGRSNLARAGMAERISKDIAANSATVDLSESDEVAEVLVDVTWEEIADHWLKRLPGYKSIGLDK